MDATLYKDIAGLSGHSVAADDIFKFLAVYGVYFMVALLVVLWFWPGSRVERDRREWAAASGVISALLALGFNVVISHIWDRPRPFIALHVKPLLAHAADASFPSDHAAGAFAIAVAVLLILRRIGLLALLLAALIAFSRVYVGDHYVTDVLGGAAVGIIAALIVSLARPLISLVLDPPIRLARKLHLA